MPDTNTQPPVDETQNMAQPSPETEGAPDPTEGMSDDDVAATLGFITTLSQHSMFPGGGAEEGEEGQGEGDAPVPGNGSDEQPSAEPQEDIGAFKEEVLGEISSLREDMVSEDMKKEFADIQTKLDELLKEEDKTNGQENKD